MTSKRPHGGGSTGSYDAGFSAGDRAGFGRPLSGPNAVLRIKRVSGRLESSGSLGVGGIGLPLNAIEAAVSTETARGELLCPRVRGRCRARPHSSTGRRGEQMATKHTEKGQAEGGGR
jgi:hypothetical protein